MMTEPQDREVSRIYKNAGTPEPPRHIDEALLAASRRAAGSRPRSTWSGRVWRSRVPVALAATVLLSFTVTLMVLQDSREFDTAPLAKISETADEHTKPVPSPPSKARSAPQTDNRRDRGAESPGLAEGSDTSRPGFVFVPPSESVRAVPDPRARESESRAAAQPTPAGPSAPVGAASPSRETALQRSGRASAQANSVAVGEAKERRPEKWIEDIRRLKAQGKTEEADRELAEFKKRHPEHRLPEDLR